MGLFGKKKAEPEEIDLRLDLREPEPAKVVFGQPVPCPDCGHPGYLDHIDPYARVMWQHCPSCFARWSIAEADIEAANRTSS
jgi:hypothetical protein